MRQILEVLAKAEHPVAIVTKSALIKRDIDILAPMARKGLAKVGISVTTLDRKLARSMEPRAATPEKTAGGCQGADGCWHSRGRDDGACHSGAQRS